MKKKGNKGLYKAPGFKDMKNINELAHRGIVGMGRWGSLSLRGKGNVISVCEGSMREM